MLEMLEVKDGRWFGRLDDDSPKVKWMRRVFKKNLNASKPSEHPPQVRRVYPRVDYTQAPWTVVMLRQPS